jgi:hypothetical protein
MVSYFAAAIAAHALFLSLGGLMSINSLRTLAQIQQEIWSAHLDGIAREASIITVRAKMEQIIVIKNRIQRFMLASLVLGLFGILYSIVIIALSY